jgi:hypothetical protein
MTTAAEAVRALSLAGRPFTATDVGKILARDGIRSFSEVAIDDEIAALSEAGEIRPTGAWRAKTPGAATGAPAVDSFETAYRSYAELTGVETDDEGPSIVTIDRHEYNRLRADIERGRAAEAERTDSLEEQWLRQSGIRP